MSRKPQTDRVLLLLRDRGPEGVTALDALGAVGSFRLAGRIHELRAEGFDITSRQEPGASYHRYWLHERPVQMDLFGAPLSGTAEVSSRAGRSAQLAAATATSPARSGGLTTRGRG